VIQGGVLGLLFFNPTLVVILTNSKKASFSPVNLTKPNNKNISTLSVANNINLADFFSFAGKVFYSLSWPLPRLKICFSQL